MLKGINRVFNKINQVQKVIEKLILAWSMILLAFITVGNVISRKVFNYSWYFAEEIMKFLIIIVIFMGLSYGVRLGRHIRMTAIFDLVNTKIKKILILLSTLVSFLVLFYLMYYSISFVAYTYSSGRVTPALGIPYYLTIVWVPVGFFFGGLQYLLAFIKNVIDRKAIWLSFEKKFEDGLDRNAE